ncbi:BT4734/BF3469 family protein [Segatella hominis]
MEHYIWQAYGGIKIDAACKNVSRACFLPYDPNCYVNPLVCPF